jgi:hypothetical protein
MKFFQTLILLISVTAIFTHDELVLLDQESFLADNTATGIPITIDKCETTASSFKNIQIRTDPAELIKGSSIQIAVKGMMIKEETVQKLAVETTLDGVKVFEDESKKNAKVKAGPYSYSYEQSVPTITPPGVYVIHMRLLNNKDEIIDCVKASFTI